MLVASHQDDLDAARECGLRTAYIERPLEFGAGRMKDVSEDAGNDVHAGSLVGLAARLEAGGVKALLDCRSRGGLRTVADVQTANVGSGSAAGAVLRFAELVACKRSLNVRTQRSAQPSAGAMGWADAARSSSVILACIHDGRRPEEQHQDWRERMEETVAAAHAPDGRFPTEV